VLAVCRHFRVTPLVCVNKYDLDGQATRRIESYCCGAKVDVAATIPFDQAVTEAVVQGVPVVEYSDGPAARCIAQLWRDLARRLQQEKQAHAHV
jgi:MinD superfamily P-loop ATPase